jgi:signal peptidase I
MQNLWLLLGLIVLADIFLTKFIPWGAWRKSKNPSVRKTLEWVDDILFALIAVYFINLFVFQNYQIPSSSLEKSLLVGDYLFVSKLSYGPRVPNTPLSFPLVQNTFPFLNTKSYIEWPNWGYHRVKGLGHVKRNDIVVFNFPAGDTIALYQQNPDFYSLLAQNGREAIVLNKNAYGEIMYRPVDKRENYVKRCVGLPGDSLKIINNQIYINGEMLPDKKNVQYNYYVETDGVRLNAELFRRLGISSADQLGLLDRYSDRNKASEAAYYGSTLPFIGIMPNADGMYNPVYLLPLTKSALETIKKLPYVKKVIIEPDRFNNRSTGLYYPVEYDMGWTRDNYGPIWIPKKDATITLDEKNLALYTRCIRNYENNEFEIKSDGTILINGKPTTTYTFKYDYYWMMGDNRHKSADSRCWGFVPEDHVVGKPILVWLSLDKDRGLFDGKIRWNRIFRTVTSFDK